MYREGTLSMMPPNPEAVARINAQTRTGRVRKCMRRRESIRAGAKIHLRCGLGESPFVFGLNWDHEPGWATSGAAVPAVFAGVSPAPNPGARRPGGRRDACPTTARFMEREPSFAFARALGP